MKKKKILTFSMLALFSIALVSAGIWYAQSLDILTINQPITVTGDGHSVVCNAGETCLGEEITVSNSADHSRDVTITTNWDEDVETRYIGMLELTTKDTPTWTPTSDRKVDVVYTLVGEEFEAEVSLESGEVLVYAMDKDDRFVDYASVIKVEDIDGDLPYSSDWNANADPDYCDNNGFDSYEHCNGAKLWVVKESDLGTPVDDVYPLSWANMDLYLYETDLMQYFDNALGELTIPAESYISFYPEYTVDNYVAHGEVIEMTTTVA